MEIGSESTNTWIWSLSTSISSMVNWAFVFFYHQVFGVFSKQSPKNLPTALRTEQKVVFDAEFTVGSMLIFKHFNILENNSWFSRKNKLYYIV